MKLRARLEKDIEEIKKNVANMINEWGYIFLPVAIACSEKNSNILRMQFMPDSDDEEALVNMFNNIGSFISDSVKDAHGFVIVYQPKLDLKLVKIVVKSIDGLSRVIVINGGIRHNSDSGWLDKKTDKEFFEQPTIDNLEDLWRSYRFNLITK